MFWNPKSTKIADLIPPTVVTPIVPLQKSKDEQIEELLKIEEAKHLGYFDQNRKVFKEHYERQYNSYKFQCVRTNNFLNISVECDLLDDWDEYLGAPVKRIEKLTTAINMDKVSNIYLREGYKPDDTGAVIYRHYNLRYTKIVQDKHIEYDGELKVEGEEPEQYFMTDLFEEIKDKNNNYYPRSNRISNIDHKTGNCPRSSKPDEVYFQGIKSILYVPAGLGQGVYQEIISAKDQLK